MFFSYNGTKHANNEVSFTITRTPLRSQAGAYYAYSERWDCRGDLLNYSSQAAITQAIQSLTNLYSADGGDIVFYLDDGVTPTAHQLRSSSCIGGVKVVQAPSFPNGVAAEYQPSYGRSYTFALEGILPLTTSNIVLQFRESISMVGTGGPIRVWLPVATGSWIRQQTTTQSTFRVIQAGSAVGLNFTPTPPAPIWPDAENFQDRKVDAESAQLYGLYHWPLSWSYTFESSGSLIGSPSPFPS